MHTTSHYIGLRPHRQPAEGIQVTHEIVHRLARVEGGRAPEILISTARAQLTANAGVEGFPQCSREHGEHFHVAHGMCHRTPQDKYRQYAMSLSPCNLQQQQ